MMNNLIRSMLLWINWRSCLNNICCNECIEHSNNTCKMDWYCEFEAVPTTYLTHKGWFRPRYKQLTNVGVAGVCALWQAQGDHAALSFTEIIFRAGSGFALRSRSRTIAKFAPNKRLSSPVVSLLHLGLENATQGERVHHVGKQTPKLVTVKL